MNFLYFDFDSCYSEIVMDATHRLPSRGFVAMRDSDFHL